MASWIGHFSRNSININTWTKCKAGEFFFFFCITYSSALLVIISVEIFIALYFPLKSIICTVQNSKRVSLVTGIIFALFNSHFIIISDIHKTSSGHEYCYHNTAESSVFVLFFIILPVLYSYGPFTIIIIVNGAIMYKFTAAKWRDFQGHSSPTDQALSKYAVRGTTMLLTVSFTFIILTGPMVILAAIFEGKTPAKINVVSELLSYSNHAINSVLYCVSGSRFRKELVKTLCCCKTNGQSNSRRNCGAINELPLNNVTGSPI